MPEITADPAAIAVPVHKQPGTPAPTPAPAPPPAPAPTLPPPRKPADAATANPQPRPCPTCTHPPCRARRSASQTGRYGRTQEFIPEHRTAAAIQARHRHAVIWFGESTQSFWAATPAGLTEASDADTLLLTLWARSARRPTMEQSRSR